ncbi:MAG: hypothetical protein ABJA18_10020 [bacterium]
MRSIRAFKGKIMTIQSGRAAVLLAIGASLLAACSMGQLRGESGSRTTSGSDKRSTTSAGFTPSSDARKDVREALQRLQTAYPYRLTETMSATANGQTAMPESTRVVEFAAADRTHMKWTGGPGGTIEAISIGDRHYWFADGKWTAGTVPSSRGADRGADFANKLAEMVKEVKYVGPETINGVSCYVYTGTFETTLGGQSLAGTAKVWIGADDGLIHQSDSDSRISTYANKSHIIYEYNVDVKIEKPSM